MLIEIASTMPRVQPMMWKTPRMDARIAATVNITTEAVRKDPVKIKMDQVAKMAMMTMAMTVPFTAVYDSGQASGKYISTIIEAPHRSESKAEHDTHDLREDTRPELRCLEHRGILQALGRSSSHAGAGI